VKFSFDDLTQEGSSDIFPVAQKRMCLQQYVIIWKNNPKDSTTCLTFLIWLLNPRFLLQPELYSIEPFNAWWFLYVPPG
jgi:hypothetical protein